MAFAHYFGPADHARPPVCGPTRLRWGCAGWWVGACCEGEKTHHEGWPTVRSPRSSIRASISNTISKSSEKSERLIQPSFFSQEGPVGADMGRPEEAEATTTRACHCAHQGVELQPRVESDCDALVTGASPNAKEQVQEARAKKPKRCNGLPGICEHGRQRSRCKECDGSGVCEHRRLRHYCKQCGGSGICEHGRRKSDCK